GKCEMSQKLENLIPIFFFSSRRRHTRFSRDWSSDVCSSDLTTSIGQHNVTHNEIRVTLFHFCNSVRIAFGKQQVIFLFKNILQEQTDIRMVVNNQNISCLTGIKRNCFLGKLLYI